MKKIITILTVCLFLTTPYCLYAQSWQWVKQNTGGFQQEVTSGMGFAGPIVVSDTFGNVYMFGASQSSTISFGAYTIPNYPYGDLFLTKFDANGNVKWLKKILYSWYTYKNFNDMIIDASGNIYILGICNDSILNFGSIILHNTTNIFLAKYDSLGNLIWALSPGGNNAQNAISLNIDPANNIYIVGVGTFGSLLTDSIIIGNTKLRNEAIFVAKYDSSGTAIWAKGVYNTVYNNISLTQTVDKTGNLIIAGYTKDSTLTFDTTTYHINGKPGRIHIFAAKYDSSGNLIWVHSVGGDSTDYVASTTTDAIGNIYMICSSVSNFLMFGATEIINPHCLFLKFDTAFNLLWYNTSNQFPGYLTNDGNSNIFIFGTVDTFVYRSETISTNYNNVIMKCDTSGNLGWAITFDAGLPNISSISVNTKDSIENIFLSGSYYGTEAVIGGTTLTNPNPGTINIFIAKLVKLHTLGIPSILQNKKNMLLFPNPTNGVFTIDISPNYHEIIINISDLNGKIIETKTFYANSTNKLQLMLNNYSCGTYLVTVNTDGVVYTEKLILK